MIFKMAHRTFSERSGQAWIMLWRSGGKCAGSVMLRLCSGCVAVMVFLGSGSVLASSSSVLLSGASIWFCPSLCIFCLCECKERSGQIFDSNPAGDTKSCL